MRPFASAAFVAALFALASLPASAEQRPTEASAQSRRAEARPPTRIVVRPRYPIRRFNSPYPLPYRVEYPGPRATRECVARYVQEARLSGTVIVPRVTCWWQGG